MRSTNNSINFKIFKHKHANWSSTPHALRVAKPFVMIWTPSKACQKNNPSHKGSSSMVVESGVILGKVWFIVFGFFFSCFGFLEHYSFFVITFSYLTKFIFLLFSKTMKNVTLNFFFFSTSNCHEVTRCIMHFTCDIGRNWLKLRY